MIDINTAYKNFLRTCDYIERNFDCADLIYYDPVDNEEITSGELIGDHLSSVYGTDEEPCGRAEYRDEIDEEDNEFHQLRVIGYYCPECGEPIYFDDWINEDTNWANCPVCETPIFET